MRGLAVLFLLAPVVLSQVVVSPAELPHLHRLFESLPGDEQLRCEVTPIPPALNLAFRFEAGYRFRVPQSQDSVRGWAVLTAVAPEGGAPTYLIGRTSLSEAVKAGSGFDISGYYFLGAGTYSVESTLRDDRNGVCRKRWQIVVEPSRSERAVPLALSPNTVRQYAAITVPYAAKPDSGALMRLTILLNAAAFSTHRTAIRAADRERAVDALTALIEHLPTTSVRVVVFSLEQQKEVLRVDAFQPPDIGRIAEAIAALPQTTVDVKLLRNPHGHVEFLAGLIRREFAAPDSADTILFSGQPRGTGIRSQENAARTGRIASTPLQPALRGCTASPNRYAPIADHAPIDSGKPRLSARRFEGQLQSIPWTTGHRHTRREAAPWQDPHRLFTRLASRGDPED